MAALGDHRDELQMYVQPQFQSRPVGHQPGAGQRFREGHKTEACSQALRQACPARWPSRFPKYQECLAWPVRLSMTRRQNLLCARFSVAIFGFSSKTKLVLANSDYGLVEARPRRFDSQ